MHSNGCAAVVGENTDEFSEFQGRFIQSEAKLALSIALFSSVLCIEQ